MSAPFPLRLPRLLLLPIRHHFWGSFAIVLLAATVISGQITDRRRFASGEIYRDVMDRWGAPIVQPAPSVRWVPAASVFNSLQAMPLDRQTIAVDARMSYRKRGLVYFSGFEFAFRATYAVRNREGKDVDVAFVFPIDMQRNKVLLSDLAFAVDGKPARIDLAHGADKLVWTGRVKDGEEVTFVISYTGRGLDSFTYRLDPDLPVRGFRLDMTIAGGRGYDYAEGVVSASSVKPTADGVALGWEFASLESGVPVGAVVPSEKSYDRILATMIGRAPAVFLFFFAGLAAIAAGFSRRPAAHESYLVAAAYAFFFVLVAYLAAYMNFYVAFVLSLAAISLLLVLYARRTIAPEAGRWVVALLAAFLVVPCVAVILEGHTGLVYALEILAGLAVAMILTTRPAFRVIAARLADPVQA